MRQAAVFFTFLGMIYFTSPAWGITFEKSVPQQVVNDILSDLDAVGRIDGSPASPLHQNVFGHVSGRDYIEWLNNRVERIGYTPATGENAGTTAYNDSEDGYRNHIVVTDWFAKTDLPLMARVSILFHEARHSEKAHSYWLHKKCPSPYIDQNGREIKSAYTGLPLAGEYACDSTPLGAYGVSVIMMMNISRHCRNCNEKVRNDAAFYAADQLKRMIRKSDRQKIFADASAR